MRLIYLIIFIIAIILFCYYENNIIKITKIKLKKHIKGKVKIVHISDLHSKVFGRNNRVLVKKILKLKPDLILVTGDLIDTSGVNIDDMLELLKTLTLKAPTYYILGNHENRLKNQNEFIKKIKNSGIKLLINEIESKNIKGNNFNILGINENQGSYQNYIERRLGKYSYKNYSELFNKLEEKSGVKIVLSHYPENFSLIGEASYNKYNFDIMFSGHAHGGQFIIPFIGGLYAPGQGIFPKYFSGLYEEKNSLIVSRGLGPSRFPLRLFNRPEIILLEVK